MSRDVRWKIPELPPHNPWDNYSQSRWRNRAAPIIAEVIEQYGDNLNRLRLKLRDAYPFGARRGHPYRIWCSEVKKQLGVDDLRALAWKGRLERKIPEKKVIGQTSFWPMTPCEILGAQLIRAAWCMVERNQRLLEIAEECEERLFDEPIS